MGVYDATSPVNDVLMMGMANPKQVNAGVPGVGFSMHRYKQRNYLEAEFWLSWLAKMIAMGWTKLLLE